MKTNRALGPEPFAYMSSGDSGGRPKLRSPAAELAFGAAIVAAALVGGASLVESSAVAAGLIAVGFGCLGLFMIYVGVRRLLWKREFERARGRSPW